MASMDIRNTLLLWISIFSWKYGQIEGNYRGVDIGHSCKYDAECKAGNGGEFSKCNQVLSICICTVDSTGENKCSDDDFCRISAIFKQPDQCHLECSPRGTRKWQENEDWYGEIQEHFASFVHDKKTVVCFDPWRAFNSLPDGFEIKQSTIPYAGLGAFTNVYVVQDTIFGPYKGILEEDTDTALISGYSWKIAERQGEDRIDTVWVDAKDVPRSNWLRYSNTPISASMENLVAIQYKGEIYYQAFRDIQPGTELFVWYGESYGEFLEIEKFEPPRYYYEKPGYVGGACHEDDEGTPCQYDENTVCADKTCLCLPGTHSRAGKCIPYETLGGVCTGSNGETCIQDMNAECQGGVCVCKNNTTPSNGICIPDETYGGRCAARNGEMCLLDINAECVKGLCRCKYGSAQINGECMTDEAYQGRCNGEDGEDCDVDRNAECIENICVCKENANVVDGKCELDGTVGGRCENDDGATCALDENAECEEGFCRCKSGTSNINGTCRVDEKLGGRCEAADNTPCRIDSIAICVQGICSCKKGKSDIGGLCILDGALSGLCIEGECNGENVVCDSESITCVCKSQHVSYAGKCVKDRNPR